MQQSCKSQLGHVCCFLTLGALPKTIPRQCQQGKSCMQQCFLIWKLPTVRWYSSIDLPLQQSPYSAPLTTAASYFTQFPSPIYPAYEGFLWAVQTTNQLTCHFLPNLGNGLFLNCPPPTPYPTCYSFASDQNVRLLWKHPASCMLNINIILHRDTEVKNFFMVSVDADSSDMFVDG